MATHRILIVEDDRAVARGLRYGLEKEGFETLWAASGAQALDFVGKHAPHLILLDIRLPDISGFDVCRRLRSDGHRLPILMLTARDEEVDKVLGLELGADDYIVKPYSLREVISRVRAQLRRAYGELSGGAEPRVSFGPLTLDLEAVRVSRDGVPISLTPIEFRLLRHLVAHPRQTFSRAALLEAVWGYESQVGSDRTVDVHIRHLRQKLEDDPASPRWIRTVRGGGYVFEP